MSRGRIFAVVGPSGAGKDTLLAAAKAALPDIHLARRVITRPHDAGGEAFDGITEAEFAWRQAQGAFALHWRAHGLSYGIPAEITDILDAGGTVLFNGSRAMLPEAARVFPGLRVIHVTASDSVLAERLAARGREDRADIARRLARARMPLPDGLDIVEIENSGPLDQTVAALCDLLAPGQTQQSEQSEHP